MKESNWHYGIPQRLWRMRLASEVGLHPRVEEAGGKPYLTVS